MKVLSMVPVEGESPEAFAQRAAGEVQEFFGGGEEGALGWKKPEPEAEAEPTDETAEPEAAPEEEQPEG
jgi:hypothetical protein